MAFEGDDNYNKQSSNMVHQFYFAKIEGYCLDPELEAKLDMAKKLKKQLRDEKTRLLQTIRSLKDELDFENLKVLELSDKAKLGRYIRGDYYRLEEYHIILLKHWPETINEDLKEESDPDIELAEIMKRIEELTEQLGHGNKNWAKEKKILKELEPLQRRRELLEPQVKQAKDKIPKPKLKRWGNYEYWQEWYYGSKYDLKRKIRKCLKEIRKENPYFWDEKKQAQRNQRIKEIEKQLPPLEKRYDIVKGKVEQANASVVKLQIQIKEKIDFNDKYFKLKEKFQELATKKDRESLELSSKKMESR